MWKQQGKQKHGWLWIIRTAETFISMQTFKWISCTREPFYLYVYLLFLMIPLYIYIFWKLLSKFLGEIAHRAKLLRTERTLVNIVWAHWTDYYSRQPSYYRLSGKHKVGFNHNHTPTLSQITELGLDDVFSVFTKNTCIMYYVHTCIS